MRFWVAFGPSSVAKKHRTYGRRVVSDCHVAVQLNQITPNLLSYSVAVFSKVTIGFIPNLTQHGLELLRRSAAGHLPIAIGECVILKVTVLI